jgi:hypothetical protein
VFPLLHSVAVGAEQTSTGHLAPSKTFKNPLASKLASDFRPFDPGILTLPVKSNTVVLKIIKFSLIGLTWKCFNCTI